MSLSGQTLCALFAAMLCLLSPLSIPFGAIPLSMGLFGALLAAVALPPTLSISATAVYLLLGACGLPVFGGAQGGFMHLIGPTGGYLWSYLLLSPVVSFLSKRRTALGHRTLTCFFGVLLSYTCGTLQYMYLTQTELLYAILVTILPFIPFDLAKAVLAAYLGGRLTKHLRPLLSSYETISNKIPIKTGKESSL